MKCHAVHSVKDGSVVCRAGFDKMWCPGVKDVRVYVYFFPSPHPTHFAMYMSRGESRTVPCDVE